MCVLPDCPNGQLRLTNGSCSPAPKNPTGCPATTQPIGLGTGGKWLKEDDLAGSLPLSFSRTYNGLAWDPAHDLSPGWTHRYSRRIVDLSQLVNVERPNGGRLRFRLVNQKWVADADIADRLVELKNGSVRTGWRYESVASGEIEHYDAPGRLISITNARGEVTSVFYRVPTRAEPASPHPFDHPIRVQDAAGRELLFAHDDMGRLKSVTSPGNTVLSYRYDANGNLSTVRHPDGSERHYHYEDTVFKHALTGITDENGTRLITYTYDAQGRATGEAMTGGINAHQLTFAPNQTTVTDPLGTARTYTFQTLHGVVKNTGVSQPGGAGCGPAASAIAYDANGNIASRTDFNGVVTTYQYDLTRNLETRRVEAVNTSDARTIATTWHPYWRQPTRVEEPGRVTTWVYNGDNGTFCAPSSATVPSINGGSQPIGVVCEKTVTAGSDTRTWRWTYNEHGRVLTENGPRTDVADLTTHDYWPLDATCTGSGPGAEKGCRGQLRQTTNALGHVTRYPRYNAHGQPEEIVDPNGLVTTIAYDLRQRPVSIRVGGETTTYAYDAVGQLVRTELPDGNVLTQTWDAAHRLTGISDAAGNRVVYTLDAAGNRIGEDTFDGSGQLARSITRSIDALGRVQAISGLPFVQP